MVKNFLIVLLSIILPHAGQSQVPDTAYYEHNGNYFYQITNPNNSKLLIFLHGGVNNPEFRDPKDHSLNFLFEKNMHFVKSAIQNGFDLLVPIKNDSMNWLENPNTCQKTLQQALKKDKAYSSYYLSGFSDGGTGAYKIFYLTSHEYDGLLLFNGYPQHNNTYKSVDYKIIKNKPVVFLSTKKDAVIPYEFLLTEYHEQKISNPNTFFLLKDGNHSFKYYNKDDFQKCFDVFNAKNSCENREPLHGFIVNDTLQEFYPFRKRICRKYGYGKEYYFLNKAQEKELRKGN